MEVARLELSGAEHDRVQKHLHNGQFADCEEAAFLFCQSKSTNGLVVLESRDIWCLAPDSFVSRSEFYLELTDQTRAKIIKHAHDRGLSLVEIHSHPRQQTAEFSWSDLSGFREFVPHVRWRLPGRPYAAIVFTTTSFDSLAWIDSKQPAGHCSMIVDGIIMEPTGMTYQAERSSPK